MSYFLIQSAFKVATSQWELLKDFASFGNPCTCMLSAAHKAVSQWEMAIRFCKINLAVGWKYWQKINVAVGSQIAIENVSRALTVVPTPH